MLLLERKPPQSSPRLIAAIIGTAAIYFLTARLGLLMAMQDGVVTAVWPPSGVALAALLIFSKRVWPGVWVGSFAANLWPLLFQTDSTGLIVDVVTAAIVATGSLGAAWFAAWVFQKLSHVSTTRGGVRRVGSFLLFGALLSCLISSLVGATTLCMTSHAPMAAWQNIWLTWWMGDAMGVCLFAPFLLAWTRPGEKASNTRTAEFVLCLAALASLGLFVFTAETPRFFGGMTDDFILLPLIVWAALRHGYRGATAGLVIVGLIAIYGTAKGCGPYVRPELNESLLCLDLFLFCLVMVALSIAAVVDERSNAESALATANQQLEDRVATRTRELQALAEELNETVGEQAATVNALRQSQTRLNLANTASKIGHWDWNVRTGELNISPEWLAQIGYSHDESLKLTSNRAWKERLHPDDVENVMSLTREHLQSPDKDYAAEFRLRHKDGSYRNIYSRGKCHLDSQGNPEHMIGCHVDMTELRQAEESANLFRLLADKVNDCVEIIDAKTGRFLDVNSRWCEEHGYTHEEALKLSVWEADSELDEANYKSLAVQIKKQGSALFESGHQRKDGSVFPAEVSVSHIIKDRDYFVVVLRNITERKLKDETLRNNEERLRLAMDVARMGSWDWNLNTNHVTTDSKLRSLFAGPTGHEMEQEREFFQFIHPEDAAGVDAAMQNAVQGDGYYHAIFRVVWKDGSTHWLEGRGSMVRSEAGEPIRMVGVTADITEQRYNEHLVQKYSQLSVDLNRADNMKQACRLLVDVADDLMGLDAAVVVMFDEQTGLCRSEFNLDTIGGKRIDVPSDLDEREPTPQMRRVISQGPELILRKNPDERATGLKTFGDNTRRSASLMYVPIRDDKQTVGMLSIQSYKPDAYTQDDLVLLQSIAEHCAATLSRIKSAEIQFESQERLRASLENTPSVCVQWYDEDGRVLYWNPASESVFGWKSAEAMGKTLDQLILDAAAGKNFLALIKDIKSTGKPIGPIEFDFKRRNGNSGVCISTLFSIPASGGGKHYVCMDVDITARKESEVENTRINSLLHATVESSSDGLLVIDTENKVTLYNQSFAELWRVPKELLALKDDTALLHFVLAQLTDPDAFIAGVRALYSTPEAESFDVLTFKDGRYFERYSHPQKVGDQIIGRVWNFRDVTERKRLESSLRLTQFSVDRAVDAVFWVASTGEILYVNDAACRTLGYSREELVGKTIPDIDPHFSPEVWAAHWADVKARKSFTIETDQRTNDGRLIKTEVTVNYLEFEGREYNFATTRDITERKRLESSLQLTQFTVDSAVDSVFWVAPDAEILYVNDAACRTLGYSREELVGRTVPDIDKNFPREAWPAHWEEVKQRKSFTFESDHHRKDGSSIKTEITVNYLEFEGREYNCAIMRDITERKKSEETLQMMRFSVDRAGDSVFWISRDGRILYANDAACASRGYTREEMLGMTIFALDPDYQPGVWDKHFEDLKHRNTITLETRHRTKHGREFPIEVNANYVNIGGREFNFASLRDITERKLAEEATRQSQQQFADLVNTIDGIVWEADLDTQMLSFVSYQAERILGYPANDWLTSKTFWQDHIHPDDRQQAMDFSFSQTELGKSHDFEYRMITADGRTVWMRDLVVVTMKEGKPASLRGIMVEVTNRKKAEQALLASEQHYKSLFESAPDAVLVISLEPEERGRILAANRAAAEMHGFTIEELTSMTILQLDAPTSVDHSKERMKNLLAGERQLFEIEHYRKDGSTFPLEVTAELMVVENKKYILAFDRDITERKMSERLLADQKRILELIASGNPLKQTLTELCLTIEHQCAGTRCSIMLTDEDGEHLRSFAAPNMPDDYNRAVDGLAVGPCAGCCGTAAYRCEMVITEDISTDPLWSSFKKIAGKADIRSCWSTPIFDTGHKVVGTFAVYRNVPGRPSDRDISHVNSATHTAAIAIQKQRLDEQLARSREVLRQLSVNLFETQETERRHLARELHDEVGQTLTATKIILQSVKSQQDRVSLEGAAHQSASSDSSPMLANAVQHVDHLLQIVRNLSLNLRPPMLDDFGLVSAMRWLLDQHTKTTGRIVEFTSDYNVESPDATLETACFRIAQEALTNVTRHSRAKKVSVSLRGDETSLHLVIADDGVGFNVIRSEQKARRGGSLGLLSMRERTGLVGGRLDINSSLGKGTEIHACFPLASQPANTPS